MCDMTREEIEDDEILEEDKDISAYWKMLKEEIIKGAKRREREIKQEENGRLKYLNIIYAEAIEKKDIEGIKEIKDSLDEIYKNRARKQIDRIKNIEIKDHVYDIHKLQNQRKFENQKKLTEIRIKGKLYEGTQNIVEGIQKEMEVELRETISRNEILTEEEKGFLDKLEKIELSDSEVHELIKPTEEMEILNILKFEVDLDSSPGEDGITSRLLLRFMKIDAFKDIYIKYLNYTRRIGSMGQIRNLGIMVIKNKSTQSNEYEKKRKLTKINKDSNVGNGKVWTNRMKRIILPRILPKTQFNCQEDENIIDEIREIREVNRYLKGENGNQKNGTILSIDFKNAYRSTHLRWFDLVMRALNIPDEFIEWFWMMYKDLGIMIVLNNFRSDIMKVERGFMEGHPPSMAAFVVGMIPLMNSLEEKLIGIKIDEGKTHRIKLFADDMKIFIANRREIDTAYNIIEKFEKVSGLEMHRDPARQKCQALPFGEHRNISEWPEWVTVKESMKVVGAMFSNKESLEMLNTNIVAQNFYNSLQRAYGVRGTIFQKVYYVNTYLFSKLWFTSQVFKLDEKIINKMLSKALDFIYSGENERPVRAVNFRPKELGGLGLINPIWKARAFMVKNMFIEAESKGINIKDYREIKQIYGYSDDMDKVVKEGLDKKEAKEIYKILMERVLHKNGSLIPSRNEKKTNGIKWKVAWKNQGFLKGVTAEEKCFAWKMAQDMLEVGNRIHRKNAKRGCQREMGNSERCEEIEDIYHCLSQCEIVEECFEELKQVIQVLLERDVTNKEILCYGYNHRNKKRLRLVTWAATKVLFRIYMEKNFNKRQIWIELVKEIEWNLNREYKMGGTIELIKLRSIVQERKLI